MGEVYAAQDTKLRRKVALKVLSESLARDPERLGRSLEYEAHVLASLNHPNIAAIYGLEDSTSRVAIVMELVDGVPLGDKLRRNGLPLQECLRIGIQIAAGLEAAHRAGVTHRDLKPGNVIVSSSGVVKIVDFGLAKLSQSFPEEETAATRPRTAEGHVLGTVAYMSPEQAQGHSVDARSDVFSFGTLFYELLTGTPPFRGDNAISTFAAILQDAPKPPSEITSAPLPHEADRIVLRCLRKDPHCCFQTAADLRLALEDLKEDSQSVSGARRKNIARHPLIETIVVGGDSFR